MIHFWVVGLGSVAITLQVCTRITLTHVVRRMMCKKAYRSPNDIHSALYFECKFFFIATDTYGVLHVENQCSTNIK